MVRFPIASDSFITSNLEYNDFFMKKGENPSYLGPDLVSLLALLNYALNARRRFRECCGTC